MASGGVHTALSVHVGEEAVTVCALSADDDECLSIRRPDGACTLLPRAAAPRAAAPALEAYGIAGVLPLLSGAFLVLVTNRRRVARASGYDVWLATCFELVALGDAAALPPRARADERALLAALEEHIFGCRALYFSYEHDLTHSAQRLGTRVDRSLPLWQRADPRFYFNRHAHAPLRAAGAHRWCLVLMQGHVHHHEGVLNAQPFDVITIARRGTRKAGTRFHTRGLALGAQPAACGADDAAGGGYGRSAALAASVAHFVETEQVLVAGGRLWSHVQLRGSIPLAWQQPPALLALDPHRAVRLAEGRRGQEGCAQHLAALLDEYGPEVVVLSLINQTKGAEVALGHALAREVVRCAEVGVRYLPWDFHAHTAKGRAHHAVKELLAEVGGARARGRCARACARARTAPLHPPRLPPPQGA